VSVGSLPQSYSSKARGEVVRLFQRGIGEAQAVAWLTCVGGDVALAHQHVGDDAPVIEFDSVLQRSVCPVHRALAVTGVLVQPSTELHELAGEPQRVFMICATRYPADLLDDWKLRLYSRDEVRRTDPGISLNIRRQDQPK
jgi:hypothetical protein